MVVLITGIAGYIGSATAAEFLAAGHKVIGIDNLTGTNKKSIEILKNSYNLNFFNIDMSDYTTLNNVVSKFKIDVVFHFAATSAENFTKKDNLMFYENNITNLVKLLRVIDENEIPTLIYPSSILAEAGLQENNAYVKTKIVAENLILDYAKTTPSFNYGILRYSHIAGYYSKIFLGEFEYFSVMKNAARMACGKNPLGRDFVYEADYHFVHIDEVAKINLDMAEKLKMRKNSIFTRIASKNKISVRELIDLFEKISGKKVNLTVAQEDKKTPINIQLDIEEYDIKMSIEDICKNQLEHEANL